MKITPFVFLIFLSVTISSCAWLESVERDLVSEEGVAKPSPMRSQKTQVTQAEYQELLARYQDLEQKYQALKEGRSSETLVNELKQTPVTAPLAVSETVNAFDSTTTTIDSGDIEAQLSKYREATRLQLGQPSEAMRIYQALIGGAVAPVKARAQLRMGEVLMSQGEFDLALQAFEGVITRMSHSGAVLDALRHAAVCSEKLGLTQKRTQYLSLLRDVFQIEV